MPHLNRPGWVRVIDNEWELVCDFELHKFNETQTFVDFGKLDRSNPNAIARAARELGDWLAQNHSDKIF